MLRLTEIVCFAAFTSACGSGAGGGGSGTGLFPGTQPILFADSSEGIQAFAIYTNTGALVPLSMTAVSSLSLSITGNMLITNSGKFLLVCDSTGSQIRVFSITAATGAVTEVAGSPFAIGGQGGGSLAFSPDDDYVYAAYSNGVAGFQLDASTGALTPLAGSPFSDGSSPNAVASFLGANIVLTTGNSPQQGFSVYTLTPATGALTPLAGSPFSTPLSSPPYNLTPVASGHVYATVPSDNAVLGFNLDTINGIVTAVPGSPFAAVNLDFFLGADPLGKFVYTCNEGNGTLSGYTITPPNGALNPIIGSPFGGHNCDTTVIVDPSGQYLYAANPQGDSIIGYQIDSTTGALRMLNSSPFNTKDPTLLAVGMVTVP